MSTAPTDSGELLCLIVSGIARLGCAAAEIGEAARLERARVVARGDGRGRAHARRRAGADAHLLQRPPRAAARERARGLCGRRRIEVISRPGPLHSASADATNP